jgi:hypothetical protein
MPTPSPLARTTIVSPESDHRNAGAAWTMASSAS